jgi:hypothetical protein
MTKRKGSFKQLLFASTKSTHDAGLPNIRWNATKTLLYPFSKPAQTHLCLASLLGGTKAEVIRDVELREICGPEREEIGVGGDWRKLRN